MKRPSISRAVRAALLPRPKQLTRVGQRPWPSTITPSSRGHKQQNDRWKSTPVYPCHFTWCLCYRHRKTIPMVKAQPRSWTFCRHNGTIWWSRGHQLRQEWGKSVFPTMPRVSYRLSTGVVCWSVSYNAHNPPQTYCLSAWYALTIILEYNHNGKTYVRKNTTFWVHVQKRA